MSNLYFINKKSECLFYLRETDLELRQKGLGITDAHYSDKELAFDWFVSVCNNIEYSHGCNDHMINEAYDETCSIYLSMLSDLTALNCK